MKQFINGFAIKVSKNKKKTHFSRNKQQKMQLNVFMKFVSGSSNLVAAGLRCQRLLLNMENHSLMRIILKNHG
jgi:hypothetical protein